MQGLPAWRVALFVVSAGSFIAALRLALAGQRSMRADGSASVTRLAVGLALAVLMYHGAAWSAPPSWLPLRAPVERWWLVVGGVALAIGAALLADRLESEGDGDRG